MFCSGYYGASHGAGVYPRRTVCLVYPSAHIPGCLGTFSQSGTLLPHPTQTWYWSRHRSQPFAADCIGGINHYIGVRAHQFT